MTPKRLSLSDLAQALYEEYLLLYEDEELASVAAAATLNELMKEMYQEDEDKDEGTESS